MNCTEFKEQVALLALGALDASASAACHEHLAEEQHEGCVEALDEAMHAVDSLSEGVHSAAPSHVWDRINASLVAAPSAGAAVSKVASQVWRTRFTYAAAAAVLLAIGTVVAIAAWRDTQSQLSTIASSAKATEQTLASKVQQLENCSRVVDEAEAAAALQREAVALLQLPGTTLFPLKPEKGERATANVIIHTGVKRAYVLAEGLKATPQGDYEMWVAKGTRVVAAGVMKVGADGKAVFKVDYAKLLGDLGAPDAMMITLERPGGSETVGGPTVMFGKAG